MAYILKPSDYINIETNDETQTIIKGISHKQYTYEITSIKDEILATIDIPTLFNSNIYNFSDNFEITTIKKNPSGNPKKEILTRYECQVLRGKKEIVFDYPTDITNVSFSANINYNDLKLYKYSGDITSGEVSEDLSRKLSLYNENSNSYSEPFQLFINQQLSYEDVTDNASAYYPFNSSGKATQGSLGFENNGISDNDFGLFDKNFAYINIKKTGLYQYELEYSIPVNVFVFDVESYATWNMLIVQRRYYYSDKEINIIFNGTRKTFAENDYSINKLENKENIFNRNSNQLFSTQSYINKYVPFYETQGNEIIEKNSFMRGTLNITLKSLIFKYKWNELQMEHIFDIGDEIKILTIKEINKNKKYGTMKYFYKNSIYEIINIHTRFDGGFIYDITLAQKNIIDN